MPDLKQSTATSRMIFMTDSSDHVTGKTGLTLTITASKGGGAFASITPTVTDRGSGWYALALTTAHTDTLGDLVLHATATGADPADVRHNVVAGSLDADVSTRLSPTVAGRTLDVSATGEAGIDLANVGSPTTTLALTGTTISPSQVAASVTGAVGSVTGNVGGNVVGAVASVVGAVGSVAGTVNANLVSVDAALTADGTAQAGAASTITLASSASAVDSAYVGKTIDIVSGTGVGQGRKITAYVGSTRVATVDVAWITTPDNTSKYALGSYTPSSSGSGATLSQIQGELDTRGLTTSLTTTITTNLNATILSRMAAFTYTAPLDAAATRSALGLGSANLDTQLGGIVGYIDTEVGAIKAKTDNLPASFPSNFPALSITSDGKMITSNPATSGADPSALADALATRIATDHGSGSYALPSAAPTDWIAAASLSTGAVTKLQNGLATPTNITSGTVTTVGTVTDKAGYALSATGLNAIAGFKGWTFPQMLRAVASFLLGVRSGVPSAGAGGTITYTGSSSGDYGTVTVDTSGNITANNMTPVL